MDIRRLRRISPMLTFGWVAAAVTIVGALELATPSSSDSWLSPRTSFLKTMFRGHDTGMVEVDSFVYVNPKRVLADVEDARVDRWVARFTSDLEYGFVRDLQRMDRYDEMISAKLDQRDMPRELIYLAMIESGFNPRAKSPARASGMWQFVGATARRYGLMVNRRVDERTDPVKSTDAALSYLSDLYDQFGSWYLAAAAYNAGEGRVSRLMRQVTGREWGTDADYFRIWARLPRETRDYVPKLVAAARVGERPDLYGLEVSVAGD